jgi:hypothetical protein
LPAPHRYLLHWCPWPGRGRGRTSGPAYPADPGRDAADTRYRGLCRPGYHFAVGHTQGGITEGDAGAWPGGRSPCCHAPGTC